MKNVFYCLTLLFFNSVFSRGNITTTFPKVKLNTVSQNQSLNILVIDYLRDVWTTKPLVDNIFTSLANVSDLLLQKSRIVGHLHKLVTFPINIIS